VLKKNKLKKNYCTSILASQSFSSSSFVVSVVTCLGGSGNVADTSDSIGGSGVGEASTFIWSEGGSIGATGSIA